jgi:NAD(P)-dependent dehydrogenase (short-subunit alcohol dehydrogenase family)
MNQFKGRTAVITGAASGFGLELSRIAAREGMHVVMADVQPDALADAHDQIAAIAHANGGDVLAVRVDVSRATDLDALAQATDKRFGAPHLVVNNAGVGAGGLVWENSEADWNWVLGVNVMGVVHGLRVFTPRMLAAAEKDPGYEGHIVNTASMAGLLAPPTMGIYNASKHAVVALTETLHHDLGLVTDRIHASLLCPFFVPTGIRNSERNRDDSSAALTRSQRVAKAMTDKAVTSGKVTAEQVAQLVFDAVRAKQFYIYSHPKALKSVQTRMEDIVMQRNPTDPYADKPEVRDELKRLLRGA